MSDLPIQISRGTGRAWQSHFGPGAITPDQGANPVVLADEITSAVNTIAGTKTNNSPGALDNLTNVTIIDPQTGDVLRYENNKWRNTSEKVITDGGNF
jgi:hypothetical protein